MEDRTESCKNRTEFFGLEAFSCDMADQGAVLTFSETENLVRAFRFSRERNVEIRRTRQPRPPHRGGSDRQPQSKRCLDSGQGAQVQGKNDPLVTAALPVVEEGERVRRIVTRLDRPLDLGCYLGWRGFIVGLFLATGGGRIWIVRGPVISFVAECGECGEQAFPELRHLEQSLVLEHREQACADSAFGFPDLSQQSANDRQAVFAQRKACFNKSSHNRVGHARGARRGIRQRVRPVCPKRKQRQLPSLWHVLYADTVRMANLRPCARRVLQPDPVRRTAYAHLKPVATGDENQRARGCTCLESEWSLK
jgi:hypothetical protein